MIRKLGSKRAVLLAVAVLAALASMVAIAHAAAPTIPEGATPPTGHYQGACIGCHTLTAPSAGAPAPTGTALGHESSDTSETLTADDSSETVEPQDADDVNDNAQGDEDVQESDAPEHADALQAPETDNESAQPQSDQSDSHETVSTSVHDRGTQHDSSDSSNGDGSGSPSGD